MDNMTGRMQELLSDKETMQQIAELAQMLKTGNIPENPAASDNAGSQADTESACTAPAGQNAGLPDINLLLKAGSLLSQNNEPDKNTALLLALRPHLREQRQYRVDKAVKLLRLWSIFRNLQQTDILQHLLS